MKIVMLGAGNVATHLSRTLQLSGFTIVQIYSKTKESAKLLSDLLIVDYTNRLEDVYRNADIYIYALKDSVLMSTISKLKIPNAIHIHTAGSISLKIFEGQVNQYGVIYPLQTFSKSKEINFKEVPLFVEGSDIETTNLLLTIANQLSEHCYIANSEQRKRLHLSAVFASNFTNLIYSLAEELVNDSNFSFDILKPLIAETADKIKYLSPAKAQTGPAVRFDNTIIDEHINILEQKTDLQNIYRDLSKMIYQRHIKES